MIGRRQKVIDSTSILTFGAWIRFLNNWNKIGKPSVQNLKLGFKTSHLRAVACGSAFTVDTSRWIRGQTITGAATTTTGGSITRHRHKAHRRRWKWRSTWSAREQATLFSPSFTSTAAGRSPRQGDWSPLGRENNAGRMADWLQSATSKTGNEVHEATRFDADTRRRRKVYGSVRLGLSPSESIDRQQLFHGLIDIYIKRE